MESCQHHCQICGVKLDQSDRPETLDCGGDCLKRMAEVAEGPDCVLAMSEIMRAVKPTSSNPAN
jgi:hypothetical protein